MEHTKIRMEVAGKTQRLTVDKTGKNSVQADEDFCDPCKVGDELATAVGYCQICDEYLCTKCRQVHQRQRLTSGHAIKGINQMPMGQTQIRKPDLCITVCKKHHPEIVRFYCRKHDVTGCVDCMALDHASCQRERIQDISGDFIASEDFSQIIQKLKEFQIDQDAVKETLHKQLNKTDSSYTSLIKEIGAFRKLMSDCLDQAEIEIEVEAKRMKDNDEASLKTLLAENESMLSELANLIQSVHTDNEMNSNSIFINAICAKRKMPAIAEELKKLQETCQQTAKNKFQHSSKLQKIMLSKSPLGHLSRQTEPTICITGVKQLGVMLYKVSDLTVKATDDVTNCWINDCALLSPERLVVTDGNNRNIKVVDVGDNTVLLRYQVPYSPFGLAIMNSETIAVTMPDANEIYIFQVTRKLLKSNRIKVMNNAHGINYKDDLFAVSFVNPGRVEIIDLQGVPLHIVHPKQGSFDVLKQPLYISFGHDRDTIVVSDLQTNKVSVITFTGQILHTYSEDTFKSPSGIHMTPGGDLFVSSLYDGCVRRISPDFLNCTAIVSTGKKSGHSGAITYCNTHQRLFVSSKTSEENDDNTLEVYDLLI